jgi:hypothetical protein
MVAVSTARLQILMLESAKAFGVLEVDPSIKLEPFAGEKRESYGEFGM